MNINTFFVPNFEIEEDYFNNSICLYIDVLRASSTICAAIMNGAKEIIPVSDTEQAMKIYSGLDREIRLIGGEKNMQKPANFNLGNSPLDYSKEVVEGKTIIFSTTNGTNILQYGKNSQHRIITAFVNFHKTIENIETIIKNNNKIDFINILCAGNNTLFSYEDTLCAGNLISELVKLSHAELTDSAHSVKVLFEFHKIDLFNFIKSRDHAQRMATMGLESDIDLCLQYDIFPVVPVIEGISIKKSRI